MADTEARKAVDEYTIDTETVDGFTNVNLNFKLDDGRVERFSLPPAFAHRLSDQLCQVSARAARPKG